MLLRQPHFYQLYVKYGPFDKVEDVVVHAAGFRFFAFLFGLLWLLFNRIWDVAAIFFIINVGLGFLEMQGHISQEINVFIQLTLGIWLGFSADELQERRLVKCGYTLENTAYAYDETEAHVKLVGSSA